MAYTLKHPQLGDISGIQEDGTIRFLGVQYATIKDRFSSPVVKEEYGGAIDATKYGPTVVAPPESCDMEHGLFQQTLPKPEYPGYSDTDGLNLNITIPHASAPLKKMPVVVFIHGGGVIGGNWFPQYNFAKFVKLSVEISKPVIGVNINYRMGIAGHLISKDLEDAGYTANRGPQDQRAAFRWVEKFIEGFGGDPENVTCMGESSGAAASMHLLYCEQPLFRRIITHGGSNVGLQPLPKIMMDLSYETVMASFGIQQLSGKERVETLLKVPKEDLLSKYPPGVLLVPSVDDAELGHPINYATMLNQADYLAAVPGTKWCKELLIGQCQLDSMVFAVVHVIRKAGVAHRFVESVKRIIKSREDADKILSIYKIWRTTPDDEAFMSALTFVNDIKFCSPAYLFGNVWPGKRFLYQFDQPNLWEGAWKGQVTHGLELVYLFLNYNEALDEKQTEIATKFATDLITFINGEDPWPSYGDEKGFQVYGPSDKRISEWTAYGKEDDGRTARVDELTKIAGLETCNTICDVFMFAMP